MSSVYYSHISLKQRFGAISKHHGNFYIEFLVVNSKATLTLDKIERICSTNTRIIDEVGFFLK